MNVSFRLCTEADLAAADDILVAAYQFKGSRKALLRRYLSLQPDGWWLALVDGKPVGFGGAVDYGAFSSAGMFSVYPSWQRRGIGEALTKEILAWGKARACPTMILEAEEQAISLYARQGFVEEGTTLKMLRGELRLGMQSTPGADVMQVTDIPELVAFDTQYFGVGRAKVLISHLKENPGRAFVTRGDAGQITGYLFAQPRMLGPWVAGTASDAEQLLVHALSLPFESGPSVTIPATNEDGLELLRRYSFSQQGITHYMRRGAPLQRGQRAMIYAQASSALG